MIKSSKILFKLIVILAVLVGIYFLMMTLSYVIPNGWIETNLKYSLETIASETKRWAVMGEFAGTKLDTFTDNLIFNKMTNIDQLPAMNAAMWNNGYERYWLGDISILRPLLIFISYKHMRYLNIFFIFFMSYYTLSKIEKTLGKQYVGLLLTMLCLMHFWIFPLSLQYTPVFIISLVGIILVFKIHERYGYRFSPLIYLFFIIGSVTNYFDLLTVPLLTFAFPWIFYFILVNQNHLRRWQHNYLETIILGITWLSGYALTWGAKWLIGAFILKENTLSNVTNQIVLRTGGQKDEILNYTSIVTNMWKTLMPKTAWIILAIWGLLIILIAFKGLKGVKHWITTLPLIGVGLLPFIWVFILKNHNYHHGYFTYRMFIITIMSFLTYLLLNLRGASSNFEESPD